MPAEPLTVADLHTFFAERRHELKDEYEKELDQRDKLIEAKLETMAVRVSRETADRIAALWRNGDGIGSVKTQLALVVERQDDLLDRLEALGRNGCGAHPLPVAPVPGETSSARRSVTDQSKVPATWREWFLLIPWWAYPVGLLVLLVVGPEAWERVVWLANKIGGN